MGNHNLRKKEATHTETRGELAFMKKITTFAILIGAIAAMLSFSIIAFAGAPVAGDPAWDAKYVGVATNFTPLQAYESPRSNASGDKISSNAHSADFPGLYFYWNDKQKDPGVLLVKPEVFDLFVSGSFILTAKNSNAYWGYDISPKTGKLVDGVYVYNIPRNVMYLDKKGKQVTEELKNINMVFIDGQYKDAKFVIEKYWYDEDGKAVLDAATVAGLNKLLSFNSGYKLGENIVKITDYKTAYFGKQITVTEGAIAGYKALDGTKGTYTLTVKWNDAPLKVAAFHNQKLFAKIEIVKLWQDVKGKSAKGPEQGATFVFAGKDDVLPGVYEVKEGAYIIVENEIKDYTLVAITGANAFDLDEMSAAITVAAGVKYTVTFTNKMDPGFLKVTVDAAKQHDEVEWRNINKQDYHDVYKQNYHEVLKQDYHEILKQDFHNVLKQDYHNVLKQDYHDVYKQDYHDVYKQDFHEVLKQDYHNVLKQNYHDLYKQNYHNVLKQDYHNVYMQDFHNVLKQDYYNVVKQDYHNIVKQDFHDVFKQDYWNIFNQNSIVYYRPVFEKPAKPLPAEPIPSDQHFDMWWDAFEILAFGANTTADGDYFVAFDLDRYSSVTLGFGSSYADAASNGKAITFTEADVWDTVRIIMDAKHAAHSGNGKDFDYGVLSRCAFYNPNNTGAMQIWLLDYSPSAGEPEYQFVKWEVLRTEYDVLEPAGIGKGDPYFFEKALDGVPYFFEKVADGSTYFFQKVLDSAPYFDQKVLDGASYFYQKATDGDPYFYQKVSDGAPIFSEKVLDGDPIFFEKVSDGAPVFSEKILDGDPYFFEKVLDKDPYFFEKVLDKDPYFFEKVLDKDPYFFEKVLDGKTYFDQKILDGDPYFYQKVLDGDPYFFEKVLDGDPYFYQEEELSRVTVPDVYEVEFDLVVKDAANNVVHTGKIANGGAVNLELAPGAYTVILSSADFADQTETAVIIANELTEVAFKDILVIGADVKTKLADITIDGVKGADVTIDGVKGANVTIDGVKGTDVIIDGVKGVDVIIDGIQGANVIIDGVKGANVTIDGVKGANVTIDGIKGANVIIDGVKGADVTIDGTKGADEIVDGAKGADVIIDGIQGANVTIDGKQGADVIIDGVQGKDYVIDGTKGADVIIDGTKGADEIISGVQLKDEIRPGKISEVKLGSEDPKDPLSILHGRYV